MSYPGFPAIALDANIANRSAMKQAAGVSMRNRLQLNIGNPPAAGFHNHMRQ